MDQDGRCATGRRDDRAVAALKRLTGMLGFAAVLAVACRDTVPTAESVVKARPPIASVCIVGVTCQCLVTPSLCPLPNDTTVAHGHLRLTCNVGQPLTPGDTLRCIARTDIAVGGVRRLWFAATNGATVLYPPDSLPRDTVAWRFPVTGSGTVYAATQSDSVSIRVRVRTLRVICTPAAPLRGTTVVCAASMSDSSAFAVTGWSFAASDGSFTLERADVESPFIGDPTRWAGEMATSGTVTVRATVGGTASAAISVTARDWSKDTGAYKIDTVGTPYDDPPKNVHQLGENTPTPSVDTASTSYFTIPSGPNAGRAYFVKLPFFLRFPVSYNEKAMRTGSIFYKMQPFARTVVQGTPYCARSRVVADIPGVKAHEGFNATDRNSHTEVYMRVFLQQVRVAAESLVAPSAADLTPSPLMATAHIKAYDESIRITHDSVTNPYQTDCKFNYDPKVVIR